ncbi:MAG: 50S ribosomal protein L29 [Verrucomicrobia bacterium]|jgi:large subunit ribosomal protein L29|nr:50S ribosomal protein L29 [Verrucomicrobiota bacterium]MBT7065844.1 50S ribosomal protein L29 [Verrucomicrobiota bacterium]MBT7698806.1 50S ribosomal protein L29 [Verrucomicrobiota bacterium]
MAIKANSLREQTDEELLNLMDETRSELANVRMMQRVGDGSQSPVKMRTLRRDVARIKTVMQQRVAKA